VVAIYQPDHLQLVSVRKLFEGTTCGHLIFDELVNYAVNYYSNILAGLPLGQILIRAYILGQNYNSKKEKI
jgi:hypothetical protein